MGAADGTPRKHRYPIDPRGRASRHRRVRPLRHRRLAVGGVSDERAACMSRFDRDATGRAIAVARSFGTRGRVVTPSDDLGPKGDLNDWLRVGAKGDASAFRSL